MPKVSVIMSVYNEKKYLLEAIQSILNQTFKDFEFIIIDDGSEEFVHTLLSTFTDPRIKLIRNEQNLGLTKSLNRGLFVSSGEYIARQDSDDVSELVRLQYQVNYLDRHPEIGVLGTSTTIINEIGDEIDEWEADPNPTESLKTGNKLTHGSVMFRRSIMEDLGKYDEYFKYAQDYEYWLRISKKYEIRNLPSKLYQTRLHAEMIGANKIKEQARYVIIAQRTGDGRRVNPKDLVMTNKEKIRYHSMCLYSYIQSNRMDDVHKEFWELFKLNPLSIDNTIRMMAFIVNGRDGILTVHKRFRKLRSKIKLKLSMQGQLVPTSKEVKSWEKSKIKEYPGLRDAFESNKTCFRCYYYLKSLKTDRSWNDTILSICLNPDYKWFGEQDFIFTNWFDTNDKHMQGTLIEKSKQNPIGCITPHWCKTGRILKD